MRCRGVLRTVNGMSNDEVVVDVQGLCKRYDGRLVVDHVDMEVRAGEIVGLLGANGAGKTTTVECVQGLRRPDEGTVRVFGLDPVTAPSAVRALIGSQLQSAGLPDRLRVQEAVTLFSGPRALPAGGLLEAFGLADHRRRPFGTLSGGQQQRVFLVLALLNRPRLVVLDELTQGLDPAARRDVWDAIRALRDSGTTVVLVTHYTDEAEALCGRVIVLDEGRVVDSGTPRELVDRHGRWATVSFSSARAAELAAAPGVRAVRVREQRVELHGARGMVAHIGAELVRRDAVPDDLLVEMPDLEDAVVALVRGEPHRSFSSELETAGGAR
jgi:ABC-2 type transport system ATP-binding protein